jgi:hypothetical protein
MFMTLIGIITQIIPIGTMNMHNLNQILSKFFYCQRAPQKSNLKIILDNFIKTTNERFEHDQNEILESSFDESLVETNSE